MQRPWFGLAPTTRLGRWSAGLLGVLGAMATGWIVILRKGEGSLPVVLAVAIGTLVTLFELVELAIPG